MRAGWLLVQEQEYAGAPLHAGLSGERSGPE